jgi:hypothetical protein
MKVALLVLAVGSVVFLVRVLMALLQELRSSQHPDGTAYQFPFRVPKQRGELVRMQPTTRVRFGAKAG